MKKSIFVQCTVVVMIFALAVGCQEPEMIGAARPCPTCPPPPTDDGGGEDPVLCPNLIIQSVTFGTPSTFVLPYTVTIKNVGNATAVNVSGTYWQGWLSQDGFTPDLNRPACFTTVGQGAMYAGDTRSNTLNCTFQTQTWTTHRYLIVKLFTPSGMQECSVSDNRISVPLPR